jgi:hypothetical protein
LCSVISSNYEAVIAINVSPTHTTRAEVIDLDDQKWQVERHYAYEYARNEQSPGVWPVMLNLANQHIPNPMIDTLCSSVLRRRSLD